eukprot:GEMP01032575.1.p1 GENE.GEMP01032575.1~~GEMP01032575.1.p1  ORF type:complete len:312 (+),score=54.94 GEMP01032575.1:106-1041(+)
MPWSEDGIYYRLDGPEDGPKVVLVMGLSARHVDWQQRAFLQTFCHVCAVDNRGVGYSRDAQGPVTTRSMAEDLVKIIVDELEWDHVHVVGVSMGGMISLELAWLLPAGGVESLTLISTTGNLWNSLPSVTASLSLVRSFLTQNPTKSINFVLQVLFTKEWLNQEASSPLHDGKIVSNSRYVRKLFILRSLDVPPEVLADARYKDTPFVGFNPPTPFRQTALQIGAILRHRVQPERLEEIKSKVPQITVIHGTHDLLVPAKNSESLAHQLNATLILLDAGHGLLEEKEADINDILSRGIRNEPVQAESLSKL